MCEKKLFCEKIDSDTFLNKVNELLDMAIKTIKMYGDFKVEFEDSEDELHSIIRTKENIHYEFKGIQDGKVIGSIDGVETNLELNSINPLDYTIILNEIEINKNLNHA